MSKATHEHNIPIGLAMAMAQNVEAMKIFGMMSEDEQEKIISRARGAHSKSEMHSIVNSLTEK